MTVPSADTAAMPTTRRRLLGVASGGVAAGLAGCSAADEPSQPPEATLTVRLRNRDDEPRSYEVRVRQGDSLTSSFSGVLPAEQAEATEMVATVRATDEQHDFSISTGGGQRGRTWDPTECEDFLVDAVIDAGEPTFEATCRSS